MTETALGRLISVKEITVNIEYNIFSLCGVKVFNKGRGHHAHRVRRGAPFT